jgi:HPt (histidine-containing phosphotransfer) domain-containing protein
VRRLADRLDLAAVREEAHALSAAAATFGAAALRELAAALKAAAATGDATGPPACSPSCRASRSARCRRWPAPPASWRAGPDRRPELLP